jgi:Endonuclease/Exonuclease/phosphatase family.
MSRRWIQILCVQEIGLTGNDCKDIGDGCVLVYSGGRNGVGIVLNSEMKSKLTHVIRVSDRVMSVKLQLDDMKVNVVCAYAPQNEEKEAFWRQVKRLVKGIPWYERIFFGGDLNGEVGCGNSEATERIRGIWGFGTENNEGKKVMDFALATDLAIVNTYFTKDENKLITYKSENRSRQSDFILCRRQHLREMRNAKVIPGESLDGQHKILLVDSNF